MDYSKVLSKNVVALQPSGIRKFFDLLDNMQDVIVQSVAIFVIVVTTTLSGIEYFVKNWKCLWDD